MRAIRLRADVLVDGAGTPPVQNAALLVRGDRIVEVGLDAAVSSPREAEILEFPGLTLLPGLVDCHSHLNLPGDGTSLDDFVEGDSDTFLLRSAENLSLIHI